MKAVFTDRDGVINEERSGYVKSWTEFKFIPGSLKALKILKENNLPVIIISNQSPVSRGIFSYETLEEINNNMLEEIREAGGDITEIFICPHSPDEGCECRKPRPGLLFRAQKKYAIDFESSYLIGDAVSDIEAGKKTGCKTILVETGRHRMPDFELIRPDHVFKDLLEAAQKIIDMEKGD